MTFGRAAYEAYCESVGFVSHYTKEALPTWENLAEPVQKAWCVAAEAVIDRLEIMERGRR